MLSSLFFYSWWNIAYLPIILVSMLFNYTVGVPAKQIGWVGKSGNTLIFDENGIATDDFDENQYKLEKDVLVKL